MSGALAHWLLAAMLVVVMAVCYELGIRFHARVRRIADEDNDDASDEGFSLSGVFGLLALLMAFAFGMALDRYEDRRQLVTVEAMAFDTLSSRLELLPEADRAAIAPMLKTYGKIRLATSIAAVEDPAKWAEGRALANAIERRIYDTVERMPSDPRAALVVEAQDELGDIATARHAARGAKLPVAVLWLLAVYCLAGAAMLGYSVAATNARHRTAAVLFFCLLSLAFVTVLDLDHPRGGLIVVPQDELEAAVARMT